MKNLYNEVCGKFDLIDFAKLWRGFSRYDFALYDSNTVWMKDRTIPWDNRFLGNTAITFEKQRMAIRNVGDNGFTGKEDCNILAANLVHEMFHAYHYDVGETRYPQDFKTLTYTYDVGNYQLKFLENQILAEAYRSKDVNQKTEYLNQVCGLRNERAQIIGDMIDCECLTETAEGMAEYIGCLALKELSQDKFDLRMSSYTDILKKPNKLQLDIRRIAYYSGSVLLMTAADSGLDFYHTVGSEKRTIYDIISAQLTPNSPVIVPDETIANIIKDVISERKSVFESFFADSPHKVGGYFYITGYDPMNMIRYGDYILCTHYIRLFDKQIHKEVTLMGKTLLIMEHDSLNIVLAYYR